MDTEQLIYLDYHATTPCDPRVVEAMLPYLTERFGNPSSATHRAGIAAATAVSTAREQVADLIGASPGEIIFTSSATESNNLAILGLADAAPAERRTILTTTIEHKSVLGAVRELERRGFDVRTLPVDSKGRLDIETLERVLSEGSTFLVSVQAASNEVGTIQDIAEIAALTHRHGAIMHSDAAQAVGRIPVDVNRWDVDLLSLTSHKLYGPKGVAGLYIRGGVRAWPLRPLLFGGGQEQEVRPGTLNVPAIVGFGKACQLAQNLLPEEAERIGHLRIRFEARLLAALPFLRRNGDLEQRLPGNCSLTFRCIDAEALLANLPSVALSTGSACASGALEPSYVLVALGMSREEAYQTIRVGLGRFTTSTEVDVATTVIARTATRLAQLQAGVV